MIKLQDLLREFDYGKSLWANKQLGSRLQDRGLYSPKHEPDTAEETAILRGIKDYLISNSSAGIRYETLQQLLQLKSKFPVILDPLTSVSANNMLYRGMSSDIDRLRDHVISAKHIHVKHLTARWIRLEGVNASIQSRNTSGFISMTTEFETASRF